jgi:putative ABC transport system substrate-binding protein
MRRREFISLIGGAAAWPLAARAQQGERMRRIGVLTVNAESDQEYRASIAQFVQGLASFGWTEGRNIQIDHRYAAGDVGRMHVFAKELVGLAARKQVEREGLIPSPKRREDARRQRPRPF